MAKNYIYTNGKHSYDDFKLLLDPIELPSSNEDYEEVEVEGRNGTLIVKKGRFPNKVIPATFTLKREVTESLEEFSEKLEVIENWLREATGDLIIYLKPNRSYKIKHVVLGDMKPNNVFFVTFEVSFICESFLYNTNETAITLSTTPAEVINLGTAPGEPNIKIYGSGNIQLTINSETVQINNVDGYVELDSKLLLCLNSDKTSKSRDLIGDFQLLEKGTNTISWIGAVTKVEILPRAAYK